MSALILVAIMVIMLLSVSNNIKIKCLNNTSALVVSKSPCCRVSSCQLLAFFVFIP